LQAYAAGVEPRVEMNPILIKPMGESRAQIIVDGRPLKDVEARHYYDEFVSKQGLRIIERAFKALEEEFDLIVMEGAGSPAEINLYHQDIANMRVADMADSPVILIADIDRGGVFASIYGTIKLLKEEHRERVKGVVINKFRGDVEILKPGIEMIEGLTGKPILGVIPYIHDLKLPDEDSVSLQNRRAGGERGIYVIRLPRISNFIDFDPLIYDGLGVKFVERAEELRSPSAIIIPGTKNTVEDLLWMRERRIDEGVKAYQGKVPIIGICGGYQMLGKKILDENIEGSGEVEGLGLLDVETRFKGYSKTTKRVKGKVVASRGIFEGLEGEKIRGYEIHMGDTLLGKDAEPVFDLGGRHEGAMDSSGLVFGTYLHGIFDSPALRKALAGGKLRDPWELWREELGRAASIVSQSVDIKRIEGYLQ
jgi:adenosylcobyric acid synthase